ncbi:MAG: SpoIIE family protein phosphatase [Thermoanaerobaculia bacterium]
MDLDNPRPAEVTILTPLSPPATFTLDTSSVTIGRASECTIPVQDRYLSRRHAEIVPSESGWAVKDAGSANGTFVNGTRIEMPWELRNGDRIRIGDTEIVFGQGASSRQSISVTGGLLSPTISIPYSEILDTSPGATTDNERLQMLNSLALELIEDQPLGTLFGFITDRVLELLDPSRVAIATISEDDGSLELMEVRRKDRHDDSPLELSSTIVREVTEQKKVLAFVDAPSDERLAGAHSIVALGIRSAVVAPLLVSGEVCGVLYLDYLQIGRSLTDEDVRLVGQIARVASMKLETTRLREEAIEKRLMDEEMRTAGRIQQRLLPSEPPAVPGFTLAGSNRACRIVGGDYYDFVVTPGGVWFVIADVSGKGVTAALIMSSLQSAFRIFLKMNYTAPGELVASINAALKETIPDTKFVSLIAGRLDPSTGVIEFTNAGHPPPLLIRRDAVERVGNTDLLVGLFPGATYRTQTFTLDPGEALVLFTDGADECTSPNGVELGIAGVIGLVESLWDTNAAKISDELKAGVIRHAGSAMDLNDDLTSVVIARDGQPSAPAN